MTVNLSSSNKQIDTILVLDFGSQYTQLIARRVRESNVYSEILPWDIDEEKIKLINPKGIILSGGPDSVTNSYTPRVPQLVFDLNIPILGICNGFQILIETGILPGSLIRNRNLLFTCKETILEIQNTIKSPFTEGFQIGEQFKIPVAHNEGNYFAPKPLLDELNNAGRIAFQYVKGNNLDDNVS